MLLIDRIRATLESSSKAEKRFANYVLSHDDIIYKTITEVIEGSGAGYGTVIRYCKKIGCSGFQDFKIRLAFESSFINNEKKSRNEELFTSQLSAAYIKQITETARNLEPEKIEWVARTIIAANRILVVGVAGSYPTALELTYRLTRFGLNAISEADEHMQAIRASALGINDVLIVVSFSGSTKGILDTARNAKKAKAKIIAITNYLRSPLVEISDSYLLTALWEQALEAEIGSRIPFYFIVEILAAAISKFYPMAAEKVKQTSDSVSEKQL